MLRNFADAAFDAREIQLSVDGADASAVVIPEGKSLLAKGLRPKSETTVTEALEIRFNESAANRRQTLVVRASFRENIGEIAVEVTPKFMLKVEVSEAPRLLEGLQSVVKVRVTNQSQVALDANAKLTMASDPKVAELLTRELTVGGLASGAVRDLEFTVIGRSGADAVKWPVAWVALAGDQRRIGALSLAPATPVVNEYRIQLQNEADLSALRREGLLRLRYEIRDVGSRVFLKGIQVQARILGEVARSITLRARCRSICRRCKRAKAWSSPCPCW